MAGNNVSVVDTNSRLPGHMVALPRSNTGNALDIRKRLATKGYSPRGCDGHGSWMEVVTDLASLNNLTKTLNNNGPPSEDDIEKVYPDYDTRQLKEAYNESIIEYQELNTALYHVVRGTLDLSGHYEDRDLEVINRTLCKNDVRDGKGLYLWVKKFHETDSVAKQQQLQRQLQGAKLSSNATLTEFTNFLHVLWKTWKKVRGNDILTTLTPGFTCSYKLCQQAQTAVKWSKYKHG